ncbi:MAG: glycosyltransferase [Deltaproteobacteria bacterium]|nr:glycosyltransferase [Deltaproteobacteria bacterium]
MQFSIVIPLFNEAARVGVIEDGLREFAARSPWSFEVIFVDDGSTDGTPEFLRGLAERLRTSGFAACEAVRIVCLPRNVGKGGALKAGVVDASGDWVLTLDADMATPATQIIEWAQQGFVDPGRAGPTENTIYIGSREHPWSDVRDRPLRRLAGRCFNFFVQLIDGVYVCDSQCGFKLYPRAVARACFERLAVTGWAHDVDALSRAREAGCCIVSLPVRWRFVGASKVRIARDWWRMLLDLVRIEFSWFGGVLSGRGAGGTYDRMSLAVFLILLFAVLATFRHYGVSFDDKFHKEYGEAVLAYYASSLKDLSALGYRDLFYYGGLYDLAAAIAAKALPFGEYESRHLLNALVGFLALAGCWKLGRLLSGPAGAFWSLLLAALSAGFYGHMFNNPKDIPFAAGHVWALYFILVAFEHLPSIPKGLVPKLGLAIGAAIGVRIGGALLACYLVLAVALSVPFRIRSISDGLPGRPPVLLPGHASAPFSDATSDFTSGCPKTALQRNRVASGRHHGRFDGLREIAGGVIALALTLSIASGVMLAGWPWAQQKPFERPLESVEKMTHFHWPGDVLFRGEMIPASALPWDYIPGYMAVKLPELTLVGLGLAAFFFVRFPFGRRREWLGAARYAFVAISAVFPVVYAIHKKSVIYDEMHHFLFVVPTLSCIAGATLAKSVAALGGLSAKARNVVILAAAAWAVYQLSVVVRLHPHQYAYYNRLTGGLAGAHGKYETDYWANSYKEAVRGLERFLDLEPRRPNERKTWKVAVCGPDHSARYYFPGNFTFTTRATEADFFISYTRQKCHETVKGKTIFTVRRFTVPLSVVKDLRKPR